MGSLNYTACQLALRAKLATLSAATTTAFTRATTATYTDIAGVMQTAAINIIRNAHYVSGVLQTPLYESAGTNSLLRSGDLSNAVWQKTNSSVTANAITAPDNTVTAGKVVENSATSTHYVLQSYTIPGAAAAYTASIFLRAGERSQAKIWLADSATGDRAEVIIDLSNGTSSALAGQGAGAFGSRSASVVTYANGWYRLCLTGTTNIATTTLQLKVLVLNASGTESYTGDGASGLYAWGGMIETGSSATSYVPTLATAVSRAADVDILLSATATGYARVTGSFITDGLAVGQEITPAGFATNVSDTITALTATTVTTLNSKTVEAQQAGRSLSVLTFSFATENVKFTPITGRPYIEEQFMGGPTSLNSLGALGNVTAEPMYVLNVYTASNEGFLGGSRYVDSIMALFAPSTAMALSTGDTLFVRADTGPYRGQVQQVDGWACISVKIPLRVFTNNTI